LKNEVKALSGRVNDLAWSESQRIIAVGEGKEKFGNAFTFDSFVFSVLYYARSVGTDVLR